MSKFAVIFFGILAIGLGGCGSNQSSKQASVQTNDSCVIPSTWGSQEESSACTQATECGGKCCNCSGSNKSWAAVACVEGKCAGNSVTCALTVTADFCD